MKEKSSDKLILIGALVFFLCLVVLVWAIFTGEAKKVFQPSNTSSFATTAIFKLSFMHSCKKKSDEKECACVFDHLDKKGLIKEDGKEVIEYLKGEGGDIVRKLCRAQESPALENQPEK